MKVIIAGSRDASLQLTKHLIRQFYNSFEHPITEIVSGGSGVVDLEAISFARENSIPFRLFEADWDKYGRSAGPIRNKRMAEHADVLLAIWDGKSRGTRNMIAAAEDLKLAIFLPAI